MPETPVRRRRAVAPRKAELAVWQLFDDGAGNAIRDLANLAGTLLASGARTATVLGAVMANPAHRGIIIFVNVTAVAGTTPTLAVRVNAVDPVTGTVVGTQTFANITATGIYPYVLYPTSLGAGWAGSINSVLARIFSVDFVIGGTTPSFTFSGGYNLIK